MRVAEFYLIPECHNAAFAPRITAAGVVEGGVGMARGVVGEQDQLRGVDQPFVPALAGAEGRAPGDAKGQFKLYDESCDSFATFQYDRILEQCNRFIHRAAAAQAYRPQDDLLSGVVIPEAVGSVLLIRPNIEHHMFGMIIGKGGSIDDLGALLWGQTELSCFDDAQHGVWGMSYKYHSSAVVFNERNLYRMWDIAYDGYVGGKDVTILDWGSDADVTRFTKCDSNLTAPYTGPSIIVIPLPTQPGSLPSPLPIANLVNPLLMSKAHSLATADLFVEDMQAFLDRVENKIGEEHIDGFKNAVSVAYEQLNMHRNSAAAKNACSATVENETTLVRLAYGGTYSYRNAASDPWNDIMGCGHHGPDAVGKASERAGRGFRINSANIQPMRLV